MPCNQIYFFILSTISAFKKYFFLPRWYHVPVIIDSEKSLKFDYLRNGTMWKSKILVRTITMNLDGYNFNWIPLTSVN